MRSGWTVETECQRVKVAECQIRGISYLIHKKVTITPVHQSPEHGKFHGKFLDTDYSGSYNNSMKRVRVINYFVLAILLLFASQVFAIDVAPRISDREIIEKLTKLEEGQNTIRAEIKGLQQQIADTNRRIDDLKESTNKRFDILQWMLGLFITVALSIMGIMGRILWNQQKKLTQIEATLEAQKEEISFIKSLIEKLQTLIEKLLPPRGVL